MQTRSKKPATRSEKAVNPDNPKQSDAFIEKARELDAGEENSAADVLMGRLARTPPDPKPAKRPKAKKPAK